MLTKDLLDVTKYRPNIAPVYREIDEYVDVAARVIDAFQPGLTRGEIDEEVSALETHDTFKLVRGLATLLERQATFEQHSAAPPSQVRAAAFKRGYVTSRAERAAVLAAVADEFALSVDEVDASLWADREDHAVLVTPPEISPSALLKQYNLSLTQTLLFDAIELDFNVSGNFQQIFGLMSYLGLMYTVDSDLTVTVTGPAALFTQTRKYGTTLARLVPAIMRADEWRLSAQIETQVSNERRVYAFDLDVSDAHLFPETTTVESFDSDVERDFAARIASLAKGWTITREPTILRANERVMIPDFSFERDGETFYLEIVGFWTPEYLQEKIEKVSAVEADAPLVLAVNEQLNCSTADFSTAEEVFFYDGKIPVKPVLDRLNAIEAQLVTRDLATLRGSALSLPDEPVKIETLADKEDVEPAAIERYLIEERSGIVSNGTYLSDSVLEELQAKLEAIDPDHLADVNPVLETYGVGQDVLPELGYSIQYVSLDQEEARVTKA